MALLPVWPSCCKNSSRYRRTGSLCCMTTAKTLPHWDMTVVYPGLDSPEFDQDFASFVQQITNLVKLFDEQGIQARPTADVTDAVISTFEIVTTQYNRVLEEAT